MLTEARKRDVIARAAAAGRQMAGRHSSVRLTHFLDAGTLAAVKPDEPDLDLDLQNRITRATATELLRSGVDVTLQIVDRDAYFAWLEGRANTAEARASFRNPSRQIGGSGVIRELGLDPRTLKQGPRAGRGAGGGSPEDRLVRAFLDDSDEIDDLAEDLIAADRHGVIDMAASRIAARGGSEAVKRFNEALTFLAETDDAGARGWAEISVVVAATDGGVFPDASAAADGLTGCGAFPDGAAFLPEWRTVDAVLSLHPCSLRRVLADLIAGREPADLPPAKPGAVSVSGLLALVGVAFGSDGDDSEPEDEDRYEKEFDEKENAFDRWADGRAAAVHGLVGLLHPLPPSELADEIDWFLDACDDVADSCPPVGLMEIRDFVGMALAEAGGADGVCHVVVTPDGGLDLTMATRAGRILDTRTVAGSDLPAEPSAVIRQIREIAEVVVAGPDAGPGPEQVAVKTRGGPSEAQASGKPVLRSLPGGRS
jgi:hypothetical protein